MRKCSKIARKKSWGSFWLNVWTLSLLKKYSIYRVSSIHLLWSPLKRRLGCLLICLRRPHLGRFEERVRFRHHSRYYLGGWQFSRWYRCSCYSYILLQENGTHALLCKFLRRHSFRFCLFLSHIPNNHEIEFSLSWSCTFHVVDPSSSSVHPSEMKTQVRFQADQIGCFLRQPWHFPEGFSHLLINALSGKVR